MVVEETKVDGSYPTFQCKLDRDHHRGGLLIYVGDCIPCRKLHQHTIPDDIESMFIKLNLRKTNGCYLAPTILPAKMMSISFIMQEMVLILILENMISVF